MTDDQVLETIRAELGDAEWSTRRDAVGKLVAHATVDTSRKLLEAVLDRDADPDVKAAAIVAMAQVDPDLERVRGQLLALISERSEPVLRLAAAVALASRDVVLPAGEVDYLVETMRIETALETQAALSRSVARALGSAVRERATAELAEAGTFTAIRAAALLALSGEDSVPRPNVGELLVRAAAQLSDPRQVFELDIQHLAWSNDPPQDMRTFCLRDDVAPQRTATMFLFGIQHDMDMGGDALADKMMRALPAAIGAWVQSAVANDPYSYTPFQFSPDIVKHALTDVEWYPAPQPAIVETAVSWLAGRQVEPGSDDSDVVAKTLWLALTHDRSAADPLLDLIGAEAVFERLATAGSGQDPGQIGGALLVADKGKHSETLRPFSRQMTPFVFAAMRSDDSSVRGDAAGWVISRAGDLDPGFVPRIKQRLEELVADPTVGMVAQTALKGLNELSSHLSLQHLIRRMRAASDDEEAMRRLEEVKGSDSLDASRALVDCWVKWIALGTFTSAVESAAEVLRRRPNAILPILEHLDRPLATDDLEHAIRSTVMDRSLANVVDKLRRGAPLQVAEIAVVRQWLAVMVDPDEANRLAESSEQRDRDRVLSLIDARMEQARVERDVAVKRRVAKHLKETSDKERFFEADESAFTPVRRQLEMHAVPALGRRLITEVDVETRDSMARVLGNVGDKSAVDALARAVSGEEQTRKERRDTLARYYLEPSMKWSDQAATLLVEAVAEAKGTLRVLQRLNLVYAAIGLCFLAAGLYLLLFSTDAQLRFAGGSVSIASFFGLVVAFVREPLDRIQQAMNRLVQLETAFTSFIWELNLNGTFIQSQYVARGRLESAEIAETVERVESAMRLSMELVSTYGDTGRSRTVPFIDTVLPATLGDKDTQLLVKGAWLSGGSSSGRKPQTAVVYLNHEPWPVDVVSWGDGEVRLRVRRGAVSAFEPGDGVTVGWLSLVVSGRETNALALYLKGSQKDGSDAIRDQALGNVKVAAGPNGSR